MVIAIFSDVHANIEALEVVLDWYESHDKKVDQYAYLGDIVGYGPNPEECVNRIKDLVDYAVVGNHDAAVCGRMDYSFYHDTARQALDWHSEQVSDNTRQWLHELPYEASWKDLSFTHGAPIHVEDFEYVFNLSQANELVQHWDEINRLNFIGHSHLTKSFELDEEEGATEMTGETLRFREGKKYVITAGSVGQPRDNDNRACAGLYDSQEDTFYFKRLEYDISKTAEKIFDTDLANEFGKRLFFGI